MDTSIFLKEVANLKHKTYAEHLVLSKSSANDDLIGDDDLAQILNNDWIVQIGEYLYRVNKPTESVYVLPAANLSEYQDLVNENKANKNIRKFSTEDDVIELAENGAAGKKVMFFCGEGGVGSRSQSTQHSSAPGATNGVTSTLRHSKFGIYFTIVIESYSNYALGNFRFEFPTNTDQRRFKRRCQTVEYVPYYATNQWRSIMSVFEAKYKIRENVTNFSKYHIRARCHYYINDFFMTQSALVSTSAWLEIRVNY